MLQNCRMRLPYRGALYFLSLLIWLASIKDIGVQSMSNSASCPNALTNTLPTMKFSAILSLILVPVAVQAVLTTSFDPVYDNVNGSLATVACSNGSNGLLTKGFTTFGSLPHFPFIGGAPAVTGFNSAGCGTCWKLSFTNSSNITTSINILAIDVATPNFNIALGAMNNLTNNQAEQLGRVPITATQVAASVCGL